MKYTQILEFARSMRKSPTYAEKIFWANSRRKALNGFKINRQFVIEHCEILNSKSFFIADFYCHSTGTIFEIDGNIHLEQIEYDRIREDILIGMGFNILRLENKEVIEDWNNVEFKIIEHLKKLTLPPTPSLEMEGELEF